MHHRFAPHELLELHELLTNEVLSAQKVQIMGGSVTDTEVWNFIQKCNSKKQKRIQECQALIGHDMSQSNVSGITGSSSVGYGSYGGGVSGGVYNQGGYNFGAYGGYGYDNEKKH